MESMNNILNQIIDSWSWVIENPKQILAVNKFGNILIRNEENIVYRICPEELNAEIVSEDKESYLKLIKDKEFLEDWEFKPLLSQAIEKLGELTDEQVYCFKTPTVLGGEYELENIEKISFQELISFSGELAYKIKNIPNGQQLEINWNES